MPVWIDNQRVEPTSASNTTLETRPTVLEGDASQQGSHLILTRYVPQSLLDQYRSEALKRAAFRQLPDQSWYAEIPGFPGVWASESNPVACHNVLDEVLADWLLLKIQQQDRDIPLIADIDLNCIA